MVFTKKLSCCFTIRFCSFLSSLFFFGRKVLFTVLYHIGSRRPNIGLLVDHFLSSFAWSLFQDRRNVLIMGTWFFLFNMPSCQKIPLFSFGQCRFSCYRQLFHFLSSVRSCSQKTAAVALVRGTPGFCLFSFDSEKSGVTAYSSVIWSGFNWDLMHCVRILMPCLFLLRVQK